MKDTQKKKNFFKRHPMMMSFIIVLLIGLLTLGTLKFYQIKNDLDGDFVIGNAEQFLNHGARPSPDYYDESYKGRAFNIVIIGTDRGTTGSGNQQSATGRRSDTTIIAHVSADRKNVDMVSIPRDSMVEFPSCALSNGQYTQARDLEMFNAAFSQGDTIDSSIACTIATIEKNTGVFIDGYAVADYESFKTIIDAMGGVDITVKERMVASGADLDIEAGTHRLNGKEALAFARARKFQVGGGDGSDLQRIGRQQYLMKAMVERATSPEIISNPEKSLNILSTVISSMTVNDNLGSVSKVAPIAMELKDAKINFHTVPVEPWAYDNNRVVWSEGSDQYWNDIINDTPISAES